MDTAESRLRECRQIAGRLKEELKQKAQHSRITDQDTSAMDTSTSTAPPQVGPVNMLLCVLTASLVLLKCLLLSSRL